MCVRCAEQQVSKLVRDDGAEQDGRVHLHLYGSARDGWPGHGGIAGFVRNENGETGRVRGEAMRLGAEDPKMESGGLGPEGFDVRAGEHVRGTFLSGVKRLGGNPRSGDQVDRHHGYR